MKLDELKKMIDCPDLAPERRTSADRRRTDRRCCTDRRVIDRRKNGERKLLSSKSQNK